MILVIPCFWSVEGDSALARLCETDSLRIKAL